MRLSLDKYAYLDSPIHQWEQSFKLLGLLSLIFAFACLQKLILLPIALLVTAVLYLCSRIPVKFLLARLRYPGLFIATMVILLPFVAGETVIWSWGSLSLKQEGCLAVILIVTRFICILTVSLVLFGTAPFLTSTKAMRSLGIPIVIVDMMLLTYRYLESLGETLATMQKAMKLRGFQAHKLNIRNLHVLARLTGSLLVRSYDRSGRVYQAMLLRGYGRSKNRYLWQNGNLSGDRLSWCLTSVTIAIALGLISAQIYW